MCNNFPTPHSHPSSFDSASTPEAFAKKELELGSGHLTVTDHGTLEGCRSAYDLCHSDKRFAGKLNPILGIELYVRDDNCDILEKAGVPKSIRYRNELTNQRVTQKAYEKLPKADQQLCVPEHGFWDHLKYLHCTAHFLDQEAFFTAVKLLSKADLRAEQHGSERKPLFSWADLEELGSKNVIMTSSCLIGVVGRHLLVHNDWQTAIKYYQRVRSLVKPGNFMVEMFPHTCDSNWDSGVWIKYVDGTEEKFPIWKKFKTDAGEIKAESLNQDNISKHKRILAVMQNRKFVDVAEPKEMVSAELKEGFVKNECLPWSPDGDVQLGVNRFIYQIAQKMGDVILCSDDSHFTSPDEKIVQDMRLAQSGGWKMANSYHRLDNAAAGAWFRDRMGVNQSEFDGWVQNNHDWASRFHDFKFTTQKALPTNFYPANTLEHTAKLIAKHGRLIHDAEHLGRLQQEIELLHNNGTIDLLPYFQMLEEVCSLYTRNGELTNSGRGSAAGVYLSYLLGVTHLDPIEHELSLDRFLTLTRIASGKLPDIDQDVGDRHLLVDPNDPNKGWLKERFGECVAQISTDNKLKLRSATKDVFRVKYGYVPSEINKITSQFPEAPQGVEDHDFVFGHKNSDGGWTQGQIETDPALISFAKTYPSEWEVIQKALGLTRSRGRHACAYVVNNAPISDIVPLVTVGGVRCTQFTKDAVEAMGLLKVDFLNIKILNDIRHAIKLVQDRHAPHIDWSSSRRKLGSDEGVPGMKIKGLFVPNLRCVPLNGQFHDIWNLPEDQGVFREISEGKTETVFQFHPPSARRWLKYFDFERGNGRKGLASILDLSTFTALDRPGGLDSMVEDGHGGQHNMMVEYAHRLRGGKPNGDPELNAALLELVPETMGILCYQEGVAKVYRILGGTTGAEADEFRVHISKKQMAKVEKDKEVFMRGAVERLGQSVADKIWDNLQAWSRYGFCKSHAQSYSVTAYACAWLKHHYPLEWWAAILTNADRNEINEKLWIHCSKMVALPQFGASRDGFVIEGDRIRAPFNLLRGVADKAQEQLMALASAKTLEELATRRHQWRVDNGTNVTRMKTDKKTGETKEVASRRLATSALNSQSMTALICTGALDPLFAPIEIDGKQYPLTLDQKLAAWEQADAAACLAVTGKKPTKKKGSVVRTLSPLEQYQFKKVILPALSEDLIPLVENQLKQDRKLVVRGKDTFVSHTPFNMREGLTEYPLVRGNLVEEFIQADLGEEVVFSCVGFLTAERRWSWDDKKAQPGDPKRKSAVELTIDVEGTIMKAVKWPGKTGTPSPPFNEDLSGSIAVCCCRRRPGKGVTIDDVVMIQRAAKAETTAEEKDEK